ncbi:MAG: TlpA family protein disulfide reductase [Dehalococcoidia bacterium]
MREGSGLREPAGWLALGAAGIALAAIAAWLFLDGSSPQAGPELGPLDSVRPEVGGPAPDFELLDARDLETVHRLSDYRGKTVVLNWFASWCGPCRAEMPDFEAAYRALGGEDGNVVFLVVNLAETPEAAATMLEEVGATYPAVLDSDGRVAETYRVTGMPTTYFIDPEGTIRSFGRGRITAETLKSELANLGHVYQ